jgi:hypothetical protein
MDWEWNLKHLHRYCPTSSKVLVVLEDIDDATIGFTHYNKLQDTFYITIDNRLQYESKCNVLAHEWAHVITWETDTDDHGDTWATAYGKCYNVVFLGRDPKEANKKVSSGEKIHLPQ